MKKKALYLFRNSWWLGVFFIFSFISYDQAVKKKNLEIFENKKKILKAKNLLQAEQEENEELRLMINSQGDPDFVEMVLMKELGVVPEGKLKALFTE